MPQADRAAAGPGWSSILYVTGALATVLSGAMLLPALLAVLGGDGQVATAFAATALAGSFLGGGLMFAMQGEQRAALMRGNLGLLVLAWSVLPILAAVPIHAAGVVPSFADATFEAVSALTTTGGTVIASLENVPPAILLWRAELQWIGGYATLLMGATVLSALGTGGLEVQRTLLPLGNQGLLLSRFIHMARSILAIYLPATIMGAGLLWASGLPGFDALCLALSGISTGGFLTGVPSFTSGAMPLAALPMVLLMLAGAISFLTHWNALRGRPLSYIEDPEAWLLAGACVAAYLLLTAALWTSDTLSPGSALALAFDAISLVTTTGYWIGPTPDPESALAIGVLCVAIVGGASVSTAGGIKLLRFWLVLSQARGELRRLAHPRSVIRIRFRGRSLAPELLIGIWALVIAYGGVLAGAVVSLSAAGLDLRDALVCAVAALSNIGPLYPLLTGGAGDFAALNDLTKGLLSVVMIVGRLEVLALLSLASPSFWTR